MSKVICFANHKGGVRKSTLAVSVSDAMARDGHRVLLLDLDPQANATKMVYSFDEAPASPVELVLEGKVSIGQAIIAATRIEGVHLLGATLKLSNVEQDMKQTPFSSTARVRDMLEKVAHLYDVIVIDTGPALNFLTGNALVASDAVFVPIESGSKLSLIGTDDLLRFIKQATIVNARLKFGGVILTMHDARKVLCQMTEVSVQEVFGHMLESSLPVSEPVRQAQAMGKTILGHDRQNVAARQIRKMAREIAAIVGLEQKKEAADVEID